MKSYLFAGVNYKMAEDKKFSGILTPFKLSLAIRIQVLYSSCFPPEETCTCYQKYSELLCGFPHFKTADGFEFFPCLFNRVSPENNDSMKLKKYQKASQPFSAGALMVLRGLPALTSCTQDPHSAQVSAATSAPGAVRPCPSRADPHPWEMPDPQGCPGTGTAWGCCAAPEVRASESHLLLSHPDIHK